MNCKLRCMIIIVLFCFKKSHAQTDSTRIDNLTMQIDSLSKEVTKLQNEIVELRIGKNYFDIIIGSQMDVFVISIMLITVVFTFINLKAIFHDLPNLTTQIQRIDNAVQQHQNDINETRFNSNRAFYLGHLNRKNYDWATLIALRCVELSTINKDTNGVLSWVKSASMAFSEASDSQKTTFKNRFLNEANKRLELAENLDGVDDPSYIETIADLKRQLNS